MHTTPRYHLTPAAQAAIKQASAKDIQANDAKRKLRDISLLIAAFVKGAA